MRIVLTLGVIICIAFPTMALGQTAGEAYVGQKTVDNNFTCESPGPLSCPYPPSPPLSAGGPPMMQGPLPSYQGNLRDNPNEYYQTGKPTGEPTSQKKGE